MNLDALFAFQQDAVRRMSAPIYQRIALPTKPEKALTVAVVGAPGSGKTTTLLQCARSCAPQKHSCLYVNSDHLAFYDWPIEEVASTFYDHGGKTLLIDDLHKYPNWSHSLTRIVEQCPGMQVFFSSPTEVQLPNGAMVQNTRRMPCMSFREYIAMTEDKELPVVPFEHILRFHRQIVEDVKSRITVLPLFKSYLRCGCLPATATAPPSRVRDIMLSIVNQTIEQDLCAIHGYTSGHAQQLKQVAGFIAQHAPGKINVSALARKLALGRDTIKRYLHDLEEARLITTLYARGHEPTEYTKPDKVFLHNTNICYALQYRPDTRSLYETFLVNQLRNAGYGVHVPRNGKNILVNHTYTIEATHRGEKQKVRLPRNHFLAEAGITAGVLTRIPLWLFGFMY